MSLVNLASPVSQKKERYGWGQWRTLFTYHCPVGHVVKVWASAYRGKTAVPSVGAICCPQCELRKVGDE